MQNFKMKQIYEEMMCQRVWLSDQDSSRCHLETVKPDYNLQMLRNFTVC